MGQAKVGDTVKVHYTGSFEDGNVFDSSYNKEPLQFTIGNEDVIPGFENAVVGLSEGETVTVKLPPDQAYGPYYQELLFEVDNSQFPPDVKPEPGQQYEMIAPDGRGVTVYVSEVNDSNVILDANHPLAGKELVFKIELVEIV